MHPNITVAVDTDRREQHLREAADERLAAEARAAGRRRHRHQRPVRYLWDRSSRTAGRLRAAGSHPDAG